VNSLEQIAFLIRHHGTDLRRKELLCAPDVAEALAAIIPERDPAWIPDPEALPAWLAGIPIVPQEGSPPGWWRLVRHDRCRVVGRDVSHQNCTVLADSDHA
jgi:hypothetical protein